MANKEVLMKKIHSKLTTLRVSLQAHKIDRLRDRLDKEEKTLQELLKARNV